MVKRNKRLIFFILSAHFCGLYVIFKWMPQGQVNGNSKEITGNLRRDDDENLYKLNWNKQGNVLYKKVRNNGRISDFTTSKTIIDMKKPDCGDKNSNRDSFVKIQDGFFVFSSFLDNRTGQPEIRSIAIYRTNSSKRANKFFRCHFEIRNSGKYPAYATSRLNFYEMCENHGKHYGGYIVSCSLPSNIELVPQYFKIGVGESTQESLHNSVPVCFKSRDRNVVRRKLNFGVCVPPLHGLVKPKDLIEFIELHRILGVDIFTFYLENLNGTTSKEILQILKHYQAKNEINIIDWKLPVYKKRIWYHGQSLAMNDCLYRNMADFRYVAFIDIDEILVPNGEDMTSWNDIIDYLKEHIEKFDTYSAYTFQSTFFDSQFSKELSGSRSKLKTNILTNRTKNFSIFRNKLIVRPDRIFEVGIHHVSRSWPDMGDYSVLKVKPEVARVHHYRACVLEFGMKCSVRVQDDTIPRKFGENLIQNYHKTLYDIMP